MISARHRSSFATLQATFARANSIETTTRELLPEAPRLIWDFSATSIRLPASFKASAEVEYVGRKPLGEGFIARAEKTLNARVIRSLGERLDAGLNLVLANGFSGQTLETLSCRMSLFRLSESSAYGRHPSWGSRSAIGYGHSRNNPVVSSPE